MSSPSKIRRISLRLKSLLIFSVALCLLFGIVLVLVETLLERQFTDVERDKMRQQADRFVVDLQGELKSIASTVGDWASWDDLYEFSLGRKPSFASENLNDYVLANLHLDFFTFWQQDGSLTLLKTISSELEQDHLSVEVLLAALRNEHLVPQQNISRPVTGYMLAGDKIVLVTSSPIVRSNRSGPPAGTLIGGKIFGSREIKNLEKFAGYRFKFIPRSLVDHSLATAAPAQPNIRVDIVNSKTISATVPIFDTCGAFIATAELSSPRLLHIQAAKTIRVFIIALASAAGILLFVVWYLLDANVIHPVRRLADKLTLAAAKGQLPSDLGSFGGNELADLAHRIEDLARNTARAEANYRAIVEDQTEFIFRYRPDGRITFANEASCRYFRRKPEEMLGSNADELIALADLASVKETLSRLSVDSPVVVLDHRVDIPGCATAWFRRTDRALFTDTGELRELQCVARDFTQAHLTRERLEISETRYRCLFENAADGILITRLADHIIADANSEMGRMLNLDLSAIVNQQLESLPPFKIKRIQSVLAKLIDSDSQVNHAEVAISHGEDRRHYFEVTASFSEIGGESVTQLNFRDITLRKRATDELRELSGHLLRLQDEERRRIARELHDSTAQNLSALQMALTQLETLVPQQALSILKEIRTLTDLSLREIRTISYLLHPPLLDEVGLLFALRWYVDGFITRTEIIVRLDVPETLERLKPEIETTIFRVVQEGLSNIHRHSGSRRAWIRLTLEKRSLVLEIRDEGRGGTPGAFTYGSPNQPVLGVGIAGMRERLRQFDGSLVVESDRHGTRLCAILPLEADESEND